MMNKITQLKLNFILLTFLVFLGYNTNAQTIIESQSFTSGSLPAGWGQTSITFTSYARFTSINSVLTSPVYDLSNYINVTLSMSVAKFGTGTDGPITVEISNDGGVTWTAQTFNSATPTSSTYVNTNDVPISVTGSNVKIRFIRINSPSEKRLQNYVLKGELAPTGPTIIVDDSGMSSFGNQDVLTYSTSQSFSVSGSNLTTDVTVTAPSANFEVSLDDSNWSSSVLVAQSSGTITDVPVYVRFYPQTNGTKTGDITLSSTGATNQLITVSGTGILPQLTAPVATSATLVTSNSFTANWNAVSGATSYAIDISTSPTFTISNGFMSDLIISEYVEGSSNNKYIEIFNGTGNDVDLSNYELNVYANGSTSAGTTSTLSGTLLSGSTIVYKNSGATIYAGASSSLSATNFNGNDVITLSKMGNNIDVVGVIGNGSNFAVDQTLTRISSVFSPTTTYSPSQWTVSSIDNVSNLGIHSFDGGLVASYVPGYENLNVGNVTSYMVTGLVQGTTYYYRVRAVGPNTSENSNVISLTTVFTSVTWNGTSWTNTVGPDSTMDAIIEGVYSTSTNGAFNAKTVTLNSGSLTVNSDTTIEIQDELVNNLTSAAVVIENNAILRQFNNVANTGQITVRRNSADALRLDYTAWSSPVSGQNALAFSPATLPNRFYDYDASSNAYVSIVPSTTDFTAGKGILIRTPNNWSSTTPATYPGEFKGVPNNGDVTTTVVEGFNLLGNPYTSPISATSFLLNTNNSSTLGMNTIHFWTHTIASNPVTGTYATSNYATHNGAGGVAAAAGGEEPDGIIQVGQGFVVEVDVNGTAEFNNSMRLSASNGQFFKSANQTTTLEKHRMWLDLTSPQYGHNQILVGYIEGATNTIDSSLDAKLFGQSNSVIYSTINNTKYVIQSRALPFTASDIVPLGLIAQTAGQYTISMNHVDGLFDTQDIYLRDNLLNITHDIKGSPYTFVSDAGQFDSRFEIVYAAPLATDLPNFNENSVVVYTNEAGITINAGQIIIDNVKVYDVRGRLLFSQLNVNANSLVLDKINASNQVLILQIGSVDNKVISKKIVN